MDYRISTDGYIEYPEVVDAKLLQLCLRGDSLEITLEALSNGSGYCYTLECSGIVIMRIDGLAVLNISLDFFASADSFGGVGIVNDALMNSLFEHDADNATISSRQAYQKIIDREFFLFGNEPSCGCEIALICRRLAIFMRSPYS